MIELTAIVLWFLMFEADMSNMSWQSFVILNLAGLIALSFWLGTIATRISRLEEERREIAKALTEARQKQVEEVSKLRDKHAEEVQRMRSAYHHMAGFLQSINPDFCPLDVDVER